MDRFQICLVVFGLITTVMTSSPTGVQSAEVDLTTRDLAAQLAEIMYQHRQPTGIGNSNALGPLLTNLLSGGAGGTALASRLAASFVKAPFQGTQPLFMPITVLASSDFASRFFCDKDKKKKEKPKPTTTTEAPEEEEEEEEEEEGYDIHEEHKPTNHYNHHHYHYSTTSTKPEPTHHYYTTPALVPTHHYYYTTPEHPPYHHYTSTTTTPAPEPSTTKQPSKKPIWWSLFTAPIQTNKQNKKNIAKGTPATKTKPAEKIDEQINQTVTPYVATPEAAVKSESTKPETSAVDILE